MSVFQHPHRSRGIVHTAMGAFNISRGLVELPDEIGEALGWRRVGDSDQPPTGVSAPSLLLSHVLAEGTLDR